MYCEIYVDSIDNDILASSLRKVVWHCKDFASGKRDAVTSQVKLGPVAAPQCLGWINTRRKIVFHVIDMSPMHGKYDW